MASVVTLIFGGFGAIAYFLKERVPARPAPATTASLGFKKKTNFDSKLVSKQMNEKRSKGHDDEAMTSAYSLDHAFDIDDDPDRN